MADPIAEFKARQREVWALGSFADVATFTTQVAGHLVRCAGIRPGQKVLDVGSGTGVVAITAAQRGATVTGIDLTPELIEQARASANLAGLSVNWQEGDAENLPYADRSFDVVLSQFGHMFAPRPEVVTAEMLRVLAPGGTIAFATWPPEHYVGSLFTLISKYLPQPPGTVPSILWGDVNLVRERLGDGVRDLHFERGVMRVPALTPQHFMAWQVAKVGPLVRATQALGDDPQKLATFQKEALDLTVAHTVDNVMHQDYLLTRARKAGGS